MSVEKGSCVVPNRRQPFRCFRIPKTCVLKRKPNPLAKASRILLLFYNSDVTPSLVIATASLFLFSPDVIYPKMEWLFGKKKTPQEMLRQNQRALQKAMRELDRENNRLEIQEKKVIADIKKGAKAGQMVN